MALYFVDNTFDKPKNKFSMYKEAFFKEEQPDLAVLVKLMNCYKYFFLTPSSLVGQVNGRFGKYVSILLTMVCQVYCYFAIKLNYQLTIDSPVTRFLLTALWCVMNVFFLMSCFMNSNVFKQGSWKDALKSVDQAEYVLRKLNFNAPKNNCRLYLQVVFIFVPYFLLGGCQIFFWTSVKDVREVYGDCGITVSYFYMNLFFLFMLRLTGVLKLRYAFVEEALKKIAQSKMGDQDKVKKLADIVRLYKSFMLLMDNINDIFGSHLFFYICVSVSYLLCAISYNLDTDNVYAKNTSILSIVTASVYTVFLIVLIMSCDSVESSGLKMIKTCYNLHESCESTLVKEHLRQLAQYAEQWRPTISAAGFYNVNQSTLSATFEAIITYLVIIIQFNLALA